MKIGFVGMGNMGYAIAKGILKNSHFEVFYYEINKERENFLKSKLNIVSEKSIVDLVKKVDLIIMAVKPYQYEKVSLDILKNLREEQIIISIAAGINMLKLREMFNGFKRIVRSMPNTPALVNCGITGVVYDEEFFSDFDIENINKLFTSFGEMQIVTEEQLHAVTAISGSLPAYVDIFVETLADIGVKYGLTREIAYKFASKSVEGSAKLIYDTKEHPAVLKDRVCSPSGTTIVAVEALEKYGFRNAIWQAGNACYNKSKKMEIEN